VILVMESCLVGAGGVVMALLISYKAESRWEESLNHAYHFHVRCHAPLSNFSIFGASIDIMLILSFLSFYFMGGNRNRTSPAVIMWKRDFGFCSLYDFKIIIFFDYLVLLLSEPQS
jgi:hypothetical protein